MPLPLPGGSIRSALPARKRLGVAYQDEYEVRILTDLTLLPYVLTYSLTTQVCVHRYDPSAAIFLSSATESELKRR